MYSIQYFQTHHLNIFQIQLLKKNHSQDNINQVLVNLFNNAVKFTPDNGNISIDIEEKRDKVWISITNSGHGIEPEQIEHIWDRFYKTDKSRSRERTGVGLGLYIVKQILNMHKEEITAELENEKKCIIENIKK